MSTVAIRSAVASGPPGGQRHGPGQRGRALGSGQVPDPISTSVKMLPDARAIRPGMSAVTWRACRASRAAPPRSSACMRDGRDHQGQDLPGRVAGLPGQGQRVRPSPAASAIRPSPAVQRPAGQAPASARDGPWSRDGVADRGEMAQRRDRISGNLPPRAEPEPRGAPPVAARLGAPGDLTQQRVLAMPAGPAGATTAPARLPPAARHAASWSMAHASTCAHRGVLGIQQPGGGPLPLVVCSPAAARPATPTAHPASAAAAPRAPPASASSPAP